MVYQKMALFATRVNAVTWKLSYNNRAGVIRCECAFDIYIGVHNSIIMRIILKGPL